MTLLTVAEVAKKINRSDTTVRRYIQSGAIKAERIFNEEKGEYPFRRYQYQIKSTDVEKFLLRRQAGDFRSRYDDPGGNGPKKQGQDYTYMYMPFSQSRATELCRMLDAKERLFIFEYFYWLKVNNLEEYKRMAEWMAGYLKTRRKMDNDQTRD